MKNKFFLFVFLSILFYPFFTCHAAIIPGDIIGGSTTTLPSYMTISPRGTSNLNASWSSSDITVKISVNTLTSEVKTWRYCVYSPSSSSYGDWVVPSSNTAYPVLTETGRSKIEIQTFNSLGKIVDTYTESTYFIDKTFPSCSISIPETTDSEEIVLDFYDFSDSYSGINSMSIQQSPYLDYDMFIVGNIASKGFSSVEELKIKPTAEEHYGKRYIYVCLNDYANNRTYYTVSTTLIPKKPSPPILTSPADKSSFFSNEDIPLVWRTQDTVNRYALPTKKTEILVTNTSTGDVKTYTVNGAGTSFSINSLPKGLYTIKVKCYIWDNVYSESEPITVNVDIFKNIGNVQTIAISKGSPISYISVLTEYDIPAKTDILGKIYYNLKDDGLIRDSSCYVPFKITSDYSSNVVKLPIKSSVVKVEYILKNNSNKSDLSPILDSVIVFAK